MPSGDTFEEEVWTCEVQGSAAGAPTSLVSEDIAIDRTGALSAWTAGTSMLEGRFLHGSIVLGNRLYVLGGAGEPYELLDHTEFATVGPSGVSSWTETTPLPAGMSRPAAATGDGFFYVAGGYTGTQFLDTVYYATHGASGHIGTWVQTTDLPLSVISARLAADDGYLYLCGGWVGGNIRIPDCYYSEIQIDGSLGAWNSTEPLPDERYAFGFVALDGFVYAIGGQAQGDVASDNSWYSEIQADGSLGPWQTADPLPMGLSNLFSVEAEGFLYALPARGTAPVAVYWAEIQPDGSPGPWTATEPIPGPRYTHAAGAFDGMIFVTGGRVVTDGPGTVDVFWAERQQ